MHSKYKKMAIFKTKLTENETNNGICDHLVRFSGFPQMYGSSKEFSSPMLESVLLIGENASHVFFIKFYLYP